MLKSDIPRIVWEKDAKSQRHYLDIVSQTRRVDLKVLEELGCFFIPNSRYLAELIGPEVMEYELGMYSSGQCVFVNYLVIPQIDVSGEVVAFVGYNFIQKVEDKETGENNAPYYKDNNRDVYKATDYLFWVGKSFDMAWEKQAVVLVDGVFDAINLYAQGVPVAAFLGSQVTASRVMQLIYIDNWFVARDNDRAGHEFLDQLKFHNPRTFSVTQNVGKDVDDVLKSECKEEYVIGLRSAIDRLVNYSLLVKPQLKS